MKEDIKDKGSKSRHDGLINKVFWNGNRVIRVNFISKYSNISKYLLNRYKDSDSYRETIQRIKLISKFYWKTKENVFKILL